ncbi:F-box protein SKIP8-like [Primulina huaijiensis]|uniref:F-box protein SKIP8-like n=1 Tax=Primulina huaijiensis TaxID=1492673 RepID=UPI003CC78D5F
MEFTIYRISFASYYPSSFVAIAVTLSCFFFALFLILRKGKLQSSKSELNNWSDCSRTDKENKSGGGAEMTALLNGGENGEIAAERQTGVSMMEQLVPEITTHALSYLDYPSLCRLSMTNSRMREAANDDNAWKALFHKDFTLEQDNVTPPNGWKAYYAATRAIVNINLEFFRIVRDRALPDMALFWLNADYVKCFHANGESFSGYNAVMGSWQLAFSWENVADFQIRDVRTRVLTDMSWVSMNAYIDLEAEAFNVTNIYEFHHGRWYMVHHHISALLIHGVGLQLLPHG